MRPRDLAAQDRAMARLAGGMADDPRRMLQLLAEAALECCEAETTGISLLETQGGEEIFRWEALAGVHADQRHNTLPRDASPCGVTLDRGEVQLFYRPERCFPALNYDPPFHETLLIPFHVGGRPVGTVWIGGHRGDCNFDRGDVHFVRSLTAFAAAGWQLWQAAQKAEEANRVKDAFLASLSHELRTPLHAISSAAQLLSTGRLAPAQLHRISQIMESSAKLQLALVNDLLDISRIVAGKMEMRRQAVDPAAVLRSALAVVRHSASSKRINLQADEDQRLPTITGDAVRLQQVICNVLSNAIKFTPEGGTITVEASADPDTVDITIHDSGIGISPEVLPQIFERFKQTNEGRAHGGLGLGLAIALEIVSAHGGTIVPRSDGHGRGSSFRIRLPRASPPRSPQSASA